MESLKTDTWEAFQKTHQDSVDEETEVLHTVLPTFIRAESQKSKPEFSKNDISKDYELVREIGKGGMGIVHLARQKGLGRLIAVKELRRDTAANRRQLMNEALIQGRLEHPNIVPVHQIGQTGPNASPVIFMRNVRGKNWSQLLNSLTLEENLGILLQVCHAIRYAHDHDIVHRDLKPENVMIGDYGEVYVLDWGIALSLTGEYGLPTPDKSYGTAGTPAYMAPEMVINDEQTAKNVDQRTDVYLLGAMLHEVLAGEPPHSGPDLLRVYFAAHTSSPPEFAKGTNPELAGISSKAMSRRPEDRFQNVQEFSDSVETALSHISSFVLSAVAQTLLNTAKLSRGVERVSSVNEAEFGFRQALSVWSENPDAIDGVQECHVFKINHAIENSDFESARAQLGALRGPQKSVLEETIDDAEQRVRESDRQIKKIVREGDVTVSANDRQKTVFVLGLIFVAFSTWMANTLRTSEATMEQMLNAYPRNLVFIIVIVIAGRKRLFANVVNRQIIAFPLAVIFGILPFRWMHYQLESSVLGAFANEQVLIWFCMVGVSVVSRSIAIFVASSSYILVALLGLWIGVDWILVQMLSIAHIITFGTMFWVWREDEL